MRRCTTTASFASHRRSSSAWKAKRRLAEKRRCGAGARLCSEAFIREHEMFAFSQEIRPMKIAIVGAGIIGVTTAWELAVDGHEVAVFDRRNSAAEESSFANAGVVAPGYVTPWAAPGMRAKALRSLFSTHGAVKLRWPLSAGDLRWIGRFQRACALETYLLNRARLQRLAFYSRLRLRDIVAARELEYDRSEGYMVLLRGKREHKLV